MCNRPMESAKIVVLSITSAVIYGVLHDQITARVCVEYFTIGHPQIIRTDSPTLLAILWGVIATWWVGLLLGVPAAVLSRFGSWPKYTARMLLRSIVVLSLFMGCASFVMGIVGYLLAAAGCVWLVEPLASMVPESKHNLFLADLWAHGAAYGVGFFGGLVVLCVVAVNRSQMAAKEVELSGIAPYR